MAPRTSVDERLRAAQKLRDESDPELLRKGISTALKDRTGLVVAEAAKLIRAAELQGFETELLTAWELMLVNPLKTDPGCTAKTAIVEALSQLEYDEPEFYQNAIRYRQLEPSWGGREDSAVNVRGAAAFAIARSGRQGIVVKLTKLVEMLVNEESRNGQVFAVQAIADTGRDEAIPVLRLRFGMGPPFAEVLGACMTGLLGLAPETSIPLVAGCLKQCLVTGNNELLQEAAVALGECGRAEAVSALISAWKLTGEPGIQESLLTSIGLSREATGIDFLISLFNSDQTEAEIALNALGPVCVYPDIKEKVREAVNRMGDPFLVSLFERRYGTAPPF